MQSEKGGPVGSTSHESLAAKAAGAPPPQSREPLRYLMELMRYSDVSQHIFLETGTAWPPATPTGGAVNEIQVVDSNGAYVSLAEMARPVNQAPLTMLNNLLGGPNRDRLAVHIRLADIAAAFGEPPEAILRRLARTFPSAVLYREGGPPSSS